MTPKKPPEHERSHGSDTAVIVTAAVPLPAIEHAAERARSYSANAKAASTRQAYGADWRHFSAWCARARVTSLPATPETVALYLAELAATHKTATIARRMAAIAAAHKARGLEPPTSMRYGAVASVWQGIKRTNGRAQNAKAPVLLADLRAMVQHLRPGRIGIRDHALLLVGFAGAFRRSELVALSFEDAEFTSDGVVINLRRSKTDQEAEGRKIGIPYGSNPETCPVRALKAWIETARITSGRLFRSVTRHGKIGSGMSGYAVALMVKRYADAAGLNCAAYSGHSLRAGLATSAAIAGASERSIMNQTGHKSTAMVRRYIRDASLFRENAAAKVGL
jgi:integrase